MIPLNDQQRLFLVETMQLFQPWSDAARQLALHKYSMKWQTVKGRDYLYRVVDASGNAKSLGVRGPETEAIYQAFIEGKARAKERHQALDERIRIQARLNKAVHLGRLPLQVAGILEALDTSKARNDFRVVGTHAIYAYESMAAVHLRMELLASGDVDLLYDPRKKLAIVAKNLDGVGLLGLLKKADSTFEVNTDQPFRATNDQGFMVDLIIPQRDMRETEVVTFAENDLRAVEVPNLHWLANAPAVESVVIASNGRPIRLNVPDPRAFAVHKAWLSQQVDREPVKKSRDLAQSQMVMELIRMYLPLYPLESRYLRCFPKGLMPEFQ